MCSTLGNIPSGSSLMDALNILPLQSGLRLEAALDFYESLRMARIINHTRHDPRSLNIDLDDFMHNYKSTVRNILNLLELDLTTSEEISLEKDLNFYDVSTSTVYRWSMSNPFVNHVNTDRSHNEVDMMSMLETDEVISTMYKPILELMP